MLFDDRSDNIVMVEQKARALSFSTLCGHPPYAVLEEYSTLESCAGHRLALLTGCAYAKVKAQGMVVECPLYTASCRYSAVIEGGKFKSFNLEADGTGTTCSLAPNLMSQL